MERIYSTQEDQPVKFFTGSEVEHSPAHGMKTLFIVGIQPKDKIKELVEQYQVEHIYFGANQSFESYTDSDDEDWQQMISAMLMLDYCCTLDFDVKFWPRVQKYPFAQDHRFIPMISVKMPYAVFANLNTTVKFDDIDFNKTNPGVWCHQLKPLTQSTGFTDWAVYSKDTIIKM